MEKTMVVELRDIHTGDKRQVPVEVKFKNGALYLRPEGTGDYYSEDKCGFPIMMEYYNGSVRLVIWSDINQQDPTHIIPLEGALESKRQGVTHDAFISN